ncbi:MAG TPA: electron transfer flavoprotein subunit beta/FixA family protein [Acidimicrobiales bacterium]|nr:electron transfer flavoprotein subunit beta/FixA family protein [Acidimicrobiales bacterium]
MKIAVCVKHVPDSRVRIDAGSKRLDRSGAGELNKFDTNAVEEALRVKERLGEGDVVVVSMGPEGAADTVRAALALGADRGVLVSDPGAIGSDLLATSRVLAKVLEREQPDLILFGQQASDGAGAVLWAAVAERLGVPSVSQATELVVEGGRARVTRQTERGDDVVEAPLPLAVAVSDAINDPRYASLKGVMAAKRKPLETLSLADLGVDAAQAGEAGSKTVVLGIAPPPARSGARRVEEGDAAQAIVDFLAERQLV